MYVKQVIIICILTYFPLHTQSINDDLILSQARLVFATNDGSYLMSMSSDTIFEINSQINKVLDLYEGDMWDPFVIRSLSDAALTRLALLALVGNFTSGAATSWEQPCKVVLNAQTGLLQAVDLRNVNSIMYIVLILVLCVSILKHWIDSS